MKGFLYHDVRFDRKGSKGWIFAKGEISNNSAKDYHTAVFRYSLFTKDQIAWTGLFKIRGLRRGQTKAFEILLENLDFKLIPTISKQDICFESGY